MKIFNEKVSIKFNDKLMSSPYFQEGDNWKLIAPSWTTVKNIYQESLKNKNNKQHEIPSYYISYPFKGFDVDYRDVLQELLRIGILIDIDWTYRFCDVPLFSHCRKYKLGDDVKSMVMEDDVEYLKKLHEDKVFRGKELNKKNKKKNRFMKNNNDLVIKTNYNNIYNMKYTPTDLENAEHDIMNHQSPDEVENKLRTLYNITRRMTDDIEVKIHEIDGRLHNCYNQCPKELRNRLYIEDNNIKYNNSFDIDYRAFHPSFLGIYIYKYLYPMLSSSLSYIIWENVLVELHQEYNKWNELWFGIDDPRDMMRVIFDYDNKDDVKKLLLTSINEPKNYMDDFRHWFKEEFPLMFHIWFNSDKSTTGCGISKYIEKELLRDTQFYILTNDMNNIRVMDVHDGISIFVREGVDAQEDIKKIVDYQVNLCKSRYGVSPVIKVEPV